MITNSLPDEYKSAVVTPILKNKGSKTDLNNYYTPVVVLIYNKNLITETAIVDCPFSDHKFIVGSIKLDKIKKQPGKSKKLAYLV